MLSAFRSLLPNGVLGSRDISAKTALPRRVFGLTGGGRVDSQLCTVASGGTALGGGARMAHFFRRPDRGQRLLLPVDMRD
jgi:hypothetical protein